MSSRSRQRSRSPHRRKDSRSPSLLRRRQKQSSDRLSTYKNYTWGGRSPSPTDERDQSPAEQPNFGLSGKLAKETNIVQGVELKYNEPHEAAKPIQKWRLYVFKGEKQQDLLHVHRASAYLFGRDRTIVDIPVEHPSCSKQHAVLQFRQVQDKTTRQMVIANFTDRPYIIDLESTNGTFLNGDKIPSTRYVELQVKDVLKFGESTREYVLLHPET
ncbi:SMAD/FHA domain-containing protein [Hesseltinella vesiculosa]|uniref:SMAD/FHA domain-containing protein n=1 Tax=Hesseltinella vesiculosa TaxID=101127 RepID=A0A1X2G6I2_9FUNG|nr:SMAD/FHA domain-containing protein [Hesseltinella vesiculosa]